MIRRRGAAALGDDSDECDATPDGPGAPSLIHMGTGEGGGELRRPAVAVLSALIVVGGT